jgi:peptidyl-prolyl cis-trans isomerase SurA
MKKILFLAMLLWAGISAFGQAQNKTQVKKVLADKIVGQVGDRIILRSDILNAIIDFKRNYPDAGDAAPTECEVLEGQLIQKALVLQAEKDSLKISEEDIEAKLENQIRQFIGMYGSKEILEEIAGRTVYQIKEDFRIPFRERELADEMRSKVVGNVRITPNEVKEYFNKIPKDSLPFYEMEVEMSQLVIHPKATRDVEEYVIQQLNDYRRQVEVLGKSFEQLAKLHSEDPGVRENNGYYALNRNERNFDPAFMAAAFRLKDGQISPVFKSKFGYHIIQMISRNGDDAGVRHILKIPPITDEEMKATTKLLDSVRNMLMAGTMTFGEAVNKYSTDEKAKFTGGSLAGRDGSNYLTIDQLTREQIQILEKMKPGEFSKPIAFTDEMGKKAVQIIYLKRKTEPHRENLADDYNRISQRALEEKKQTILEKWFKEKVPNYYVAIDEDYISCEDLAMWRKFARNIGN